MDILNYRGAKHNKSASERMNLPLSSAITSLRRGLLAFWIVGLLIVGIFLFPFMNRQQTAHAFSNGSAIPSINHNSDVNAATPTCTAGSAPTISYALGTRVLNYNRSGRSLPTQLWYPRTGSGGDTANASVASGTFPLILFSHGLGGNPFTYSNQIRPLAKAGFIVAAPYYPNTKTGSSLNLGDVPNQGLDASYVITQVLALNTRSGDLFNAHIRTACGVGAAGHSAGAATTHTLLTIHRDSRVTAAVLFAAYNMGSPVSPSARVLHIHGDHDPTCAYSGAQAMYKAYGSWPKAFLTELGGSHDSYIWSGGRGFTQAVATDVDWMRYALYGDTAARNRLSSDATSSVSRFTSSGL